MLDLGFGNAFLQGIGQESDVGGLVIDHESVIPVGLPVRRACTAVAVLGKIRGIVGLGLLLLSLYFSSVQHRIFPVPNIAHRILGGSQLTDTKPERSSGCTVFARGFKLIPDVAPVGTKEFWLMCVAIYL